MERKQYLNLCRECAALRSGLYGTKINVPDGLKVVHAGIAYYPEAYVLSFNDNGNPEHTAVLHDLKANAIVYADLQGVAAFEGGDRL